MSEPSGLQIMQENMAAAEAGEDMPHEEDTVYGEPDPDLENIDNDLENDDDLDLDPDPDPDPEISEIAKKDGFMTKEQWVSSGKAEEDYMSEEEFSKVGELRDGEKTRQQLSKQYVQMESTMNEMLKSQQQMVENAKKTEREKVIAELKIEQKDAIEYSETEKALELERKIADEQAKDEVKPEVKGEKPQAPQAMTDWYNNNKHWYSIDINASNLINAELAKHEAGGLPFEEGIAKAEAKARKYYPQYFDDAEPEKKKDDPPKIPRPASESSRKRGNQKESKKTFKDLDPAMQSIARRAAKASGLSESEYMENM